MKRRTRITPVLCLGVGVLLLLGGCRPENVQTPAERLQAAGPEVARLLVQAREATEAGAYQEALMLADQLIKTAPEFPEGYYQQGLVYFHLHQLGAADSALARAVARDPYSRGAWYQRGHVAFEDAHYDEAIRRYQRQRDVILKSPPRLRDYYQETDRVALPQTWLQIGRAYQLKQVADSARLAYQQVLQLDSTHAQAHSWLAELYEEEGRMELAVQHARKAWEHDTDTPAYADQLGGLLFKQGNVDEALPLLEQAVRAMPWKASANYNLGRALVASGAAERGEQYLMHTDVLQELEQAINHARAGVARYPKDPARWEFLSNLLGRAGLRAEQAQTMAVARTLKANDSTQVNPN